MGQALRGSGDLYAWVDELVCLRRAPECLMMTIEHRAAASPDPLMIRLAHQGPKPPHMVIVEGGPALQMTLAQRILQLLTRAPGPCVTSEIRATLSRRKETVVDVLRTLESSGQIRRVDRGWVAGVKNDIGVGGPSPGPVD